MIFTANCDVNLWNSQCQRFDVGTSVYRHFFDQAVIPDGAWDKVEQQLAWATHGTIKYDAQHFEWNFGFNLMSLAVSREINMSYIYERLASSMLQKRYIRGQPPPPRFAHLLHPQLTSRGDTWQVTLSSMDLVSLSSRTRAASSAIRAMTSCSRA